MRDRAMIVAAAILAVFGFLAVGSYSNVPPTVVASTQAVAESTEVVETVEPQLPDGMSSALYHTLQAEGSAWVLPTDQAVEQLPASIVRVLESHNAVLRVVDEAAK